MTAAADFKKTAAYRRKKARADRRDKTIITLLKAGKSLDVYETQQLLKYGNATSVNGAFSRIRKEGIDIVKIHPRRGIYAMAGSPPALEAARKYSDRPNSTRLIPYAWDPCVNNNAPQNGDRSPGQYTADQVVLPLPPQPEERYLLEDDFDISPAGHSLKDEIEKEFLRDMAAAKTIQIIISCPPDCDQPEILTDDEGMVMIETDGRPISVGFVQFSDPK